MLRPDLTFDQVQGRTVFDFWRTRCEFSTDPGLRLAQHGVAGRLLGGTQARRVGVITRGDVVTRLRW